MKGVKNVCHPELDSGSRCSVRGFTLIELLVVVLMIGVLAAVALPQYQKAVIRSRSTQALTLIKTIGQAVEMYYDEYGKNPTQFAELPIVLPAQFKTCPNTSIWFFDCRQSEEWSVKILRESGYNGVITLSYTGNGPYKGMGLAYIPRHHITAAATRGNVGKVMCIEAGYNEHPKITGRYCTPFLNGRDRRTTGGYHWYVVDI